MSPRDRLSTITYAAEGPRAAVVELYGPTDDERRRAPRRGDPAREPFDGARLDPLSRPEPPLPPALAHQQRPLFTR